jgi:Bacterial Ig-like domain (group 3)
VLGRVRGRVGGRPGVTGAGSATALTLALPSVIYGDEQDEQFTATVSAADAADGTPTGTVTVAAGETPVCTITLVDGTGSCAPTPDEFPVGPVTLTASYGGDGTFAASSSTAVSLQVTSPPPPAVAATTTTLKLSKTGLTYGDEQAEKISVTVVVGGGGTIPAGIVTVGSGATDVCKFSLSRSGTGSCALKAVALPPGAAKLTASYAGNADFGSSASARMVPWICT